MTDLVPIKTKRRRHRTGGALMTKQSEAEKADINAMMRRFAVHGTPIPTTNRLPAYGDFSNVDDYRTAVETVQRAQERFDALPADLREWADNDPVRLVERMNEEGARESLIAAGLLQEDDAQAVEAAAEPPENTPEQDELPTG